MYARTKASLPHAQRMENLTWRMMALALRKKREEDAKAAAEALEAAERPDGELQPKRESPAEEPSKETKQVKVETPPDDNAPRGRRIDKGKTKTRVEGFDDGKPDEEYVFLSLTSSWDSDNHVIREDNGMDWREMSRSRSRMSVDDWRAGSRSRSRPPFARASMGGVVNDYVVQQTVLGSDAWGLGTITDDDTAEKYDKFQTDDKMDKFLKLGSEHSTSPGINIPGRDSSTVPSHYGFPGMRGYDGTPQGPSTAGPSHAPHFNFPHSALSTPAFHPSSLPAHGFYGPPPIPPAQSFGTNPQFQFPRRVRKTSFDHTVVRDGVGRGSAGRHQVNGRPLPPGSTLVSPKVSSFIGVANAVIYLQGQAPCGCP